MDNKMTGGNYKIGITRAKYLDICNIQFIQGNIDGVKQSLNAFLGTIVKDTEAEKELQRNIDVIEEERLKKHKDLHEELQKKGFLEQPVNFLDKQAEIDMDALLDVKALCWAVAISHGLFNE